MKQRTFYCHTQVMTTVMKITDILIRDGACNAIVSTSLSASLAVVC